MQILYERDGNLLFVDFDATVKELHASSAIATEHYVEDGVALTDHVRPERDRLSAEAHVTNTPIRTISGAEDGAVSAFQVTTQATGFDRLAKVKRNGQVDQATRESSDNDFNANVLQWPSEFDRVTDVYTVLRDLMVEGIELTILTSLRQYDSMVLVDMGAPRDGGDNSNAIMFSLEFVEVRKAQTETVDSPEPLETRAERRRRRGAQATEEPEAEEDRSLAAALVEDQLGVGLITSNRANGNSLFR